MALERASPSGAHWTEAHYWDLFRRPESGASQGAVRRLVLVIEGSLEDSRCGECSAGECPLGFLVAQHISPEWELENIVVRSEARRGGLGSRLLDALLAAARETHSTGVFLEVRESNLAARKLYEKAGFLRSGQRKSYYSSPLEDAVLYRLEVR